MVALLQQVDPNKPPHSISISKSAHVGGFGLSSVIIMTEKAVFQANWCQVPAELIPNHIASLPELRKDRYGNLVFPLLLRPPLRKATSQQMATLYDQV